MKAITPRDSSGDVAIIPFQNWLTVMEYHLHTEYMYPQLQARPPFPKCDHPN